MKYHYFHSFFTDSVEWELGSNVLSSSIKGEDRLQEQSSSGTNFTRPPPRTASGGEFDWGGTSVKR